MDQNRGEEPELTVAGSYGNYNALTLHGLASRPIGENLNGKISFSSRRRDGYLENHIGQYSSFYQGQGISDFEFNDKDPRKIDRDSFRAALRYVPASRCPGSRGGACVPGEYAEDEVMVVVSATDGLVDAARLFDFLRPRMTHFMLPRYIRIGEFPLCATTPSSAGPPQVATEAVANATQKTSGVPAFNPCQ